MVRLESYIDGKNVVDMLLIKKKNCQRLGLYKLYSISNYMEIELECCVFARLIPLGCTQWTPRGMQPNSLSFTPATF